MGIVGGEDRTAFSLPGNVLRCSLGWVGETVDFPAVKYDYVRMILHFN